MKPHYLFGFLACCYLLLHLNATAQDVNITVKGTVTSVENDESLPGVTITVRGTTTW